MDTRVSGVAPRLLGALVGWTRSPSPHGSIIRIQTATTLQRAAEGEVEDHYLALNALQLRRLGHDLIRAADEHEERHPGPSRRWWKRVR